MRNNKISFRIVAVIAVLLITASCKKHKTGPDFSKVKGSYFSVFQFIQDQFKTYYGQPYTFSKIVVLNGKKDSSMANIDNIDWRSVLKPFIDADISDKKFLGHYNFNMFEDATTGTRNFFYEAIDKDLFTRRLQISADPTNNRIVSIYIETAQKSFWGDCTQKLYYEPLKYIQIQRYEKKRFGSPEDLKIEYKFL